MTTNPAAFEHEMTFGFKCCDGGCDWGWCGLRWGVGGGQSVIDNWNPMAGLPNINRAQNLFHLLLAILFFCNDVDVNDDDADDDVCQCCCCCWFSALIFCNYKFESLALSELTKNHSFMWPDMLSFLERPIHNVFLPPLTSVSLSLFLFRWNSCFWYFFLFNLLFICLALDYGQQ